MIFGHFIFFGHFPIEIPMHLQICIFRSQGVLKSKEIQKNPTLKDNFTLKNMWTSSSKQFLKSHWALIYIVQFGIVFQGWTVFFHRAGRFTYCVYQLIKIICYSRGNLNLDCVKSRVAEVVWKREGCSPKSLDSKKVSSTIIHYFVAILRFVAIYALLGDKNGFGGSKTA